MILFRRGAGSSIHGSLALLGARGISMGAGILAVSIAVRAMDETSFGFWAALTSLTTLTAGLDLGIGNSTRNRVTTLRAHGDETGAAEAFASAVVLVACVSAALALLVISGSVVTEVLGVFEWSGGQQQALVLAVIFLGVFQIGNLGQLALYAREQPSLVALLEAGRWVLTIPALFLVAGAGGELISLTATYFAVLAVSVGASFPILWMTPAWRRGLPGPGLAWRNARDDLRAGSGFAALQVISTLVYQTDVLLAAQLSSLAGTGDFALAQRLAMVPLSLLFAAVIPLWSRTTAEVARGNAEWARVVAERLALSAAVLCAISGVVLVVAGPWAIEVWAERTADRWLLAGLAVWLTLAGGINVFSVVLNGMGRAWPQVRWLGVTLIVKIVLALVLVERSGLAGLAWAAALALLPLAAADWHEVRRWLRQPAQAPREAR